MNKKILLVDDEVSIRKTLQEILQDEGYEVVTTETAEEGLQQLSKNSLFDSIISDIWMPTMDGLEFLQKVKQGFPEIPVIMISGHGTIETAVKATKIGAFDFIEKPLSLEKVLLTLKNATTHYQLLTENKALKSKGTVKYRMIGDSPSIQAIHEQFRNENK